MYCVDKDGWPVERIKGRPVQNLARLLLHTRWIKRGKFEPHKDIYDDRMLCEKSFEVKELKA